MSQGYVVLVIILQLLCIAMQYDFAYTSFKMFCKQTNENTGKNQKNIWRRK